MYDTFCFQILIQSETLPTFSAPMHNTARVFKQGFDPDIGIWSAGIAIGLIDDIPRREELLRRFESEKIIGGLNKVIAL